MAADRYANQDLKKDQHSFWWLLEPLAGQSWTSISSHARWGEFPLAF